MPSFVSQVITVELIVGGGIVTGTATLGFGGAAVFAMCVAGTTYLRRKNDGYIKTFRNTEDGFVCIEAEINQPSNLTQPQTKPTTTK